MQEKIFYDCFLQTKEGVTYCFYQTTNPEENVLDSVSDFDQGDNWSIDAGCNEELTKLYQEDPEDNSFVLIPKSSVIKVWNEVAKVQPKKINKSNIF